MKWNLTGGEGFIGSRLVARMPGIQKWNFGIEYDVVVHLGAMAGVPWSIEHPQRTFEFNTVGTYDVLEDARGLGAKVIFASSAAAANPASPYAASKASGEAWCKAYRTAYGMEIGILRFANVYGPGSLHKTSCVAQMCKDAIEKGVIRVDGHGGQERDFVYVEDVVDVILQVPRGDFSVRTGAFHNVYYVAQRLAELSGAKLVDGERMPGDVNKPSDDWPQFPTEYTPLDEGLELTWNYFLEHLQ